MDRGVRRLRGCLWGLGPILLRFRHQVRPEELYMGALIANSDHPVEVTPVGWADAIGLQTQLLGHLNIDRGVVRAITELITSPPFGKKARPVSVARETTQSKRWKPCGG